MNDTTSHSDFTQLAVPTLGKLPLLLKKEPSSERKAARKRKQGLHATHDLIIPKGPAGQVMMESSQSDVVPEKTRLIHSMEAYGKNLSIEEEIIARGAISKRSSSPYEEIQG